MNTAAFLSKDIPKRIALLKTPVLGHFVIRNLNLFCWPAVYMGTAKGMSKEVRSGYLFPYRRAHQRGAVSAFVEDIPLNPTHPSYRCLEEIQSRLKAVKRPTLCLWGLRDFCFHSGFLDRFKEIYPHAETEVYPDASHYITEDAGDKIERRLRLFLGADGAH